MSSEVELFAFRCQDSTHCGIVIIRANSTEEAKERAPSRGYEYLGQMEDVIGRLRDGDTDLPGKIAIDESGDEETVVGYDWSSEAIGCAIPDEQYDRAISPKPYTQNSRQ